MMIKEKLESDRERMTAVPWTPSPEQCRVSKAQSGVSEQKADAMRGRAHMFASQKKKKKTLACRIECKVNQLVGFSARL